MNTLYQSSYLYRKDPMMYGGKQEEYEAFAEDAIQKATETIRYGALSQEKSVQELFFKVLGDLCRARHEIALKHTPNQAHNFGVMRASETCSSDTGYTPVVTPLGHQYSEYNKIFMKQLQEIMAGMKHNLRTFSEKLYCLREEVLGHESSFEVKVLEVSDLHALKWDMRVSKEELQEALGNTKKSFSEILQDYALMKQLKETNSDLYRRLSMVACLESIAEIYPSPKKVFFDNGTYTYDGNLDNLKNIYVLGTLHLEIEGKLFAMSRFLTWLYQGYRQDPVDRMAECSTAMIIHQDHFLVDDTLKGISKMFEKAVLWDARTQDVQELKNRVAILRFAYSHCMPSARGDGAIGDWMEMAVYRFHGFTKTHYNPDKLACFESLVSLSLTRYLENYDQTIIVE